MKLHTLRYTFGLTSAGLRLACLSTALLLSLAGCKSAAPADDASLAASVHSQIAGDSALNGQAIGSGVQSGVVTLSGTVANDTQRTLAARDAATVAGVKTVVNNLAVTPVVTAPAVTTAISTPPPAPVPVPVVPATATLPARRAPERPASRPDTARTAPPAPITRPSEPMPVPVPAPVATVPAPPVLRTVTVDSGTVLPVRVTQTLDSATAQQGDSFSGVLSSDVLVDGLVALPAGSTVTGRVDAVQEAAHFKGSSLLTVSLTGVSRRGERIALGSEPYTVEGKGRGKNTAAKVGGGAAVGAVLGGIFGGGKGAAIGAATGGGLGAGVNGVTRGQQVQIASESIVRFRTTSPVTVRVRADGTATRDNVDPSLQRHTQP